MVEIRVRRARALQTMGRNGKLTGDKMANRLTLIQAQQRYIDRRNSSMTGHSRRTGNAAASQLWKYLQGIGITNERQIAAIVQDARDIAILNKLCDAEEQ